MNRPPSPHNALLEAIAGALANSGRLSVAVLDFIETALFPVQLEALTAFLTDDESQSERESLLDLIFSPDLAVQIDLEPLLEAAGCTPADKVALNDRLMDTPIRAWLQMPDGSNLARIPVPDDIKSQYLARLNVTWQMDPLVRNAIENSVAPGMALRVKVRLRNAGLRPTADQQTALCRFFERMADDDPDYMPGLDLFLGLLDKDVRAEAVYDRLAAHKRFLFRSLRQARRFADLLRRSNVESLMLQGVRAPHVSPDELTYHMRLIDQICAQMFGKTESIAPVMEDPLRIVSDLATPAAAVRSLMKS